jgi:ribosomal protein S27AE
METRFIVRCHRCSHGDMPCNELRDGQRCPHCNSVLHSYSDNGREYCWLHREPMSGYRPYANFLRTWYTWRGQQAGFPNAKLYELQGAEQAEIEMLFCPRCQELFEDWMAAEMDAKDECE